MGALNVPACRIGLTGGTTKAGQTPDSESRGVYGRGLNGSYAVDLGVGRWPAHLVMDDEAGAELDAQAGNRRSTLTGYADPGASHYHPMAGSSPASPHLIYGHGMQAQQSTVYADGGGPSRWFFCSKASTNERELGCEELPVRNVEEMIDREEGSAGADNAAAGAGRSSGARNHHPTIKSVRLTRRLATWLAKLTLPPPRADGAPRRVLCPFAGSGGEMIGALRAGWDEVVGIEQDAAFVEIANARLARWAQVPVEMDEREAVRDAEPAPTRQVSLFGAR